MSAGDGAGKIPSISLGLPELPSGIRQTRPFTYSKKFDFDFTLGEYSTVCVILHVRLVLISLFII